MQLSEIFTKFDELHRIHGSRTLTSIYGAGQVDSPDLCLIFMNPTARNVASALAWDGIKAPWLGTKTVWKLLCKLGLFANQELIQQIESMRPEGWTPEFAVRLYEEIAKESIYITNIAKCTQDDAKHLPDAIYKEYLPLMLEELAMIKPKVIVTLGNQVSSVLLQKPISVSGYQNDEFEDLVLDNRQRIAVYPSYYPVGQGMRNMPKAMHRIKKVLELSRMKDRPLEQP